MIPPSNSHPLWQLERDKAVGRGKSLSSYARAQEKLKQLRLVTRDKTQSGIALYMQTETGPGRNGPPSPG